MSAHMPHLWLIGPKGFYCSVGDHLWGDTDPYGPCLSIRTWARQGIERAEVESGLSVHWVAKATVGLDL